MYLFQHRTIQDNCPQDLINALLDTLLLRSFLLRLSFPLNSLDLLLDLELLSLLLTPREGKLRFLGGGILG